MLLKGKRIIVTGGATGIGEATVLACAREGAVIASMSRRPPTDEKAKKVVEAAKKDGPGPIMHMQLDVRNQDEVNSVFEKAVAWMGGLDVLVNCHGEDCASLNVLLASDLSRFVHGQTIAVDGGMMMSR